MEELLLYIPVLAILVSAGIAYINYKANKTLNIKNQLFNEKLKLYREISREIAIMIFYLDNTETILQEFLKNGNQKNELNRTADKIDIDSEQLDLLMIEAYMIAPEEIFKLMTELSDHMNSPIPEFSPSEVLDIYRQKVNELRSVSENLVKNLREDLRITKLNKRLFKS